MYRLGSSHPQEDHMSTDTIHPTHTAEHRHTHGPQCGHASVRHLGHVDFLDYLHDGHVHQAHGDHYDECASGEHVVAEEHHHVHGDGCGHAPVLHGNHLDYIHNDHRHAAHGGHYDEH
jgi:hypothetical protein